MDTASIFSIQTEAEFLTKALEIFHFQKENNRVYGEFVRHLGKQNPSCLEEIPFLPIEFFKSEKILSKPLTGNETLFLSSGTGLVGRSQHWVHDIQLYQESFFGAYRLLFGNPEEQVILALLPNYIEQGNSSLVYMVTHLIEATKNPLSGFLLHDLDTVQKRYNEAILSGKEVVVFGVSYALLDLAEKGIQLPKARIVETGGMKGRRKELTKTELHYQLKEGLSVPFVSSEYGMTELLSQAYSLEKEIFICPPWMKILVRDIYDPFAYFGTQKSGGINVIDLANVYSCSFIQTQDMGQITPDGFKIEGRIDLADIRGCNLMVE